MKTKTLILLFFALMGVTSLFAYDFEANGIYYNITDMSGKTVSVTSGDNNYSGNVNIPASVSYDGNTFAVTSIGERAFYACSDLTSVTIPESVTAIGPYAFLYCSRLTSITIPGSVSVLGREAFNRCAGLTSVTISEGVTSIGYGAFYSCSGIVSLTIPASVTSIGERAFTGCSALTSIEVKEGNANFDSRGGCNAIIETASNSLIIGCKNTVIPDDITSIGSEAFYSCTDLSSVTIPAGVTNIGELAFMGCVSLNAIEVEEGNTVYDSRNDCNAIIETASKTLIVGCKNSIIPEGVTTIGSNAFYGCSDLTSISIPEGVTDIADFAFLVCSGLTTVSIPSTVTSIGSRAFGFCTNLKSVFSYAEDVPSTSTDAFIYSSYENATLYVWEYAYEAYSETEPWSNFGNIVGEKEVRLCAKPTISFYDGKLKFNCRTKGVTFHYDIKNEDIKSGVGEEISLTATYNISVYATKDSHEDSEVATATLCWIAVEPQTEGLTDEDAVAELKALPVLIQTNGSTISIQGAGDGTEVSVYSVGGSKQDSKLSSGGIATLNTSLSSGSVAIVKIGEKAVKVKMK